VSPTLQLTTGIMESVRLKEMGQLRILKINPDWDMPIPTPTTQIRKLRKTAQLTLFISSYAPLFILIIIRQLGENIGYMHWSGITFTAVLVMIQKFGLSIFLVLLLLFGTFGYLITFKNLEKTAENGDVVSLKDVKNKNSEAIGYIATYIIPFLFQSFESFFEIFAVIFLLYIIYRIYINSTMLLINPLLSIKYAIYEVEYETNGKKCNGLVISKDKYLMEDTTVKLYEIGHKLYYLTK
jgi:hypothetical protein